LKRNKLHTDIKKREEETVIFINSCQESYDNEIVDVSCIGHFCRNISIIKLCKIINILNKYIFYKHIICDLFQELELRKVWKEE